MDTDMVMAMETKPEALPLTRLAILLFALGSTPVSAQQTVPGAIAAPSIGNVPASTNLSSTGPNNDAVQPPERAWLITPRIALSETYTDRSNVGSGGNSQQNDLITSIAPGLRVQAQTDRLKGYLDYTLQGLIYANNSDYNTTRNQLNAFGSFEAIDKWLYVDFNGRIGQQAVSSFGAVSPSTTSINSNNAEVRNFGISPYIRGQLGGSSLTYLLRYNQSSTTTNSSSASNIDVAQWVGQLQGGTAFKNLTWAVDANQQRVDYSTGRETNATTLRGIGTYALTPEFRVSLSAGQESNDYASASEIRHNTHGYGFDWSPTERTKLSAFRERRFFGDGYNYSFSHRFPRSSISYTDTRNVSVLPNQFSTANSIGSTYDLFYPLLSQLCTTSLGGTPSQSAIQQCVLNMLGSLPANYQTTSSFLTSRATIMRMQQLAWTYHGVRDTLSIMASRSENQSTFASTALNDDFTNFNLSSIQQRGLAINLTHSLSALSNLNLLASRQNSRGNGTGSNLKTTMNMLQANLTTKLGAKTTGTLSVRHTEFESTTNPYTENALIGTLIYTY